MDLEAADLESAADVAREMNPQWADLLSHPEALRNIVFLAGGAGTKSNFADTMQIATYEREFGDDENAIAEVVAGFAEEFAGYGSQVHDSASGLTVAGVPAGYIQYSADANGLDGSPNLLYWAGIHALGRFLGMDLDLLVCER